MEHDGTVKQLCESLGIPWGSGVRPGDKSLLEVLFDSNLSDDMVRRVFSFLEDIRWPPEVRCPPPPTTHPTSLNNSAECGQDDAGDDCSTRDRVARPLEYAGYLECLLDHRYMEAMTEQKRQRWAHDAMQTGMQEPDRALLFPTVAIHETLWNQGLTTADDLYKRLFRCAFVKTLMKSWEEHGTPREAVKALRLKYLPGSVGGEEWWVARNRLGGAGALVLPGTFEYIFTCEIRVRKASGVDKWRRLTSQTVLHPGRSGGQQHSAAVVIS